jgi:hypothetical protein
MLLRSNVKPPFRNDVQCFVERLSYDFRLHLGFLYMARGSCCDMTGCIKLFKAIDPKVVGIQTFEMKENGEEVRAKDTCYFKYDNGEWVAYCPKEGNGDGGISEAEVV